MGHFHIKRSCTCSIVPMWHFQRITGATLGRVEAVLMRHFLTYRHVQWAPHASKPMHALFSPSRLLKNSLLPGVFMALSYWDRHTGGNDAQTRGPATTLA